MTKERERRRRPGIRRRDRTGDDILPTLPADLPPGLAGKLVYLGRGKWGAQLLVGPDLARPWFEDHNYTDNRNVTLGRVDCYARLMTKKLWRDNGEPIIFDRHGGLLDGQHRLAAIVKSGVTVDLTIHFGVETDTFTTMDQGSGRPGGTVMTMKGYTNGGVRSSVCRAVYSWLNSNGTQPHTSGKVMPDETILIQEAYSDRIDAAVLYAVNTVKVLPVKVGFLGLGHFLFSAARPRKSIEFLQVLRDGLTSTKGHPALVYRNRIIQDKLKERVMTRAGQWWALVYAWNAYDQNKTIRAVSLKRDPETGEWERLTVRGDNTEGQSGQ